MMDKVSPQKRLAANFSVALFACLDFFTFEDGPDRMSLNVSNEVPLCAASCIRRAEISRDYLAMQAMV
jgi:hypothetical protein